MSNILRALLRQKLIVSIVTIGAIVLSIRLYQTRISAENTIINCSCMSEPPQPQSRQSSTSLSTKEIHKSSQRTSSKSPSNTAVTFKSDIQVREVKGPYSNKEMEAYATLQLIFSRHTGKCSNFKAWRDHDEVMAFCNDLPWEPNCVSYTFGVNYNWINQELFTKETGCNAYTFDPAMTKVQNGWVSKNIWFEHVGIGPRDETMGNGWVIKRFSTLINNYNHSNVNIDLLYLDCEGVEFEVIQDMMETGAIKRVKQLFVEVHIRNENRGGWADYVNIMLGLERAGFVLVWNRAISIWLTDHKHLTFEVLHYLNTFYFENAAF